MNDPHVVSTVYRIEHNEAIDYSEAESLDRDEPGFRLSVMNGKARFEMKDHFPTFEEAEKAIDGYKRAWEFDAQLARGPGSFSLALDRQASEIIDRNPTPGRVSIRGAALLQATGSVQVIVSPPKYPAPPSDITPNPDAETMLQRYLGYREGREPLAAMAYFCLTVLENSTGQKNDKRSRAATMYCVDGRVLKEIAVLTSNKGGPEARKAIGVEQDFSSQEQRFLEEAVRALIRRVAEREHHPNGRLMKIAMTDFPSLHAGSGIESETAK